GGAGGVEGGGVGGEWGSVGGGEVDWVPGVRCVDDMDVQVRLARVARIADVKEQLPGGDFGAIGNGRLGLRPDRAAQRRAGQERGVVRAQAGRDVASGGMGIPRAAPPTLLDPQMVALEE